MDDIVKRLRETAMWLAAANDIDGIYNDICEAADEIERLREALRFYANKDNWKSTLVQTDSNEITFDSGPARRENGAIARAALEGKQ